MRPVLLSLTFMMTRYPYSRDDDDYDIDFYTAAQVPQDDCDPAKPSPRDQLEVQCLPLFDQSHVLTCHACVKFLVRMSDDPCSSF